MGFFYYVNERTDRTTSTTANTARRNMVPAIYPQFLSIGTAANTGTQAYSTAISASQTVPWAIAVFGFNTGATSTGTFSVQLLVQTGNTAVQGSVILRRMAADGTTILASSAATAEQTLSAGTKTFTLTNPALGTWGSTDRLAVDVVLRNTNTMSAQSVSLRADGVTGIDVPWSTSITEPSRTVLYSNDFEAGLGIEGSVDAAFQTQRLSPGLNGSGWRGYNAATVAEGSNWDRLATISTTSDQLVYSARMRYESIAAATDTNWIYSYQYRDAANGFITRLGFRIGSDAALSWQSYDTTTNAPTSLSVTSEVTANTEYYIQHRIIRSWRYSEIWVDNVLRSCHYHLENAFSTATITQIMGPFVTTGSARTVDRPFSIDDIEVATTFPPMPLQLTASGTLDMTGSALGFNNVTGVPIGAAWGVVTDAAAPTTISLTSLVGGFGVSAPAAGDLVIVAVNQASTVDRSIVIDDGTTAYTLIGSELYSNGSVWDANLRAAYKVMGSTPDTAFRIGPITSGTEGVAYAVWVLRNVNPVNPIGAVTTATGTGGSLADPPAITPTSTVSRILTATGAAGAALTGSAAIGDTQWNVWARADNTSDAVATLNVYVPNTTNPAAISGLSTAAGDSWAAITFEVRLGRNSVASGTLPLAGTAAGNVSAGRSGSASGTLDLTGTASGDPLVRGTSTTGALGLTGTASGDPLVRGTSTTGTLDLTGAASGDPLVRGTSTTGTLDLTGTASGDPLVRGTSTTGTLPLAGSGVIQSSAQLAAAGTLDLTGTADGRLGKRLVASGVLDHSTGNIATGVVRVAGVVAGALDLTGVVTGAILNRAAAAGTLDITGAAAGAARVAGTASGSIPLAGSGAFTAITRLVAAGTLDVAGAATGTILNRATAAGTLDVAGAATGTILNRATAAGTLDVAGAAAGTVTSEAQVVAAGALDLTGAASAEVSLTASAAGSLALSGAASSQPITYVGGQTVAITPSTATDQTITFSLTGGTDSTPQAGDLVIVSYGVGSTVDRVIGVTTAGYVEAAELYANDTYDANLSVSYKFMGAVPDTTVTVSATGATADGGQVVIQVYRNVDPVTPEDVADTSATAANGGNVNPAAITPVSPNTLLIVIGATASTGGTTYTASYLSDFVQGSSTAATNDITVGMGWVLGPAANTQYDPAAWTASGSVNTMSWASVTLALRTHERDVAFGVAEGALDLMGAATGTVQTAGVSGTASGTLTHTGAATATNPIRATAAGTLDLTGAATGAVLNRATAAGTLTHTGTATGTILTLAAAAGTLDLTGAATATNLVRATAAGTLDLTGAATSASRVAASAAGTLTHTGAATATNLVRGTAAGSLDLTGAATGVTPIRAMAAGTLTHTGTATGTILTLAAAAGTLDLTGAATATNLVRATAAGTLPLSGSSLTSQDSIGTSTGTLTHTGAAAGAVQVLASAAGSLALTGAATARVQAAATASGALTYTGTSVGNIRTVVRGTASGTLTHTAWPFNYGLVIPPVSALVDGFDDPAFSATKWTVEVDDRYVNAGGYVTAAVEDGALKTSIKVSNTGGWGSVYIETVQHYTLDIPLVFRTRWPDPRLFGPGPYIELYISDYAALQTSFSIAINGYSGGQVYVAIGKDGTIPYSTGTYVNVDDFLLYQYLRIRHDGTSGHIDASRDGVNWTTLVSKVMTTIGRFQPYIYIRNDYPANTATPYDFDLMAVNLIEPPIGKASTLLTFTGAAEGTVPVAADATASGALPLSGDATASVRAAGQAAGQLPLEGVTVAQAEARATAAGALGFTATAAAVSQIAGQATPTTSVVGSSTGRVLARATAAGALSLTGAATTLVVDNAAVAASGSLTYTGASAARVAVAAAAADTTAFVADSQGTIPVVGAAAGTLVLTGDADTDVPTLVAANGGIGFTGAASAQVEIRAATARSLTLTGHAAGLVNATLSVGRWAYEVGVGPRSQNITEVVGSGENAVSVDAETNKAVLQGAGENVVSMIQNANSVQIVEAANSVTVTKATNSVG